MKYILSTCSISTNHNLCHGCVQCSIALLKQYFINTWEIWFHYIKCSRAETSICLSPIWEVMVIYQCFCLLFSVVQQMHDKSGRHSFLVIINDRGRELWYWYMLTLLDYKLMPEKNHSMMHALSHQIYQYLSKLSKCQLGAF